MTAALAALQGAAGGSTTSRSRSTSRAGGSAARGRADAVRPPHRGARPAHLVRLLRERVPAARPLPPRARLAAPTQRRPRWNLPFTSVEESFSPLNELAVADHDGCGWKLWRGGLLRRRRRPAVGRPAPPGQRPRTGRSSLPRALPAARRRPRVVAGRVRPPGWRRAVEPVGEAREDVADLDDARRGAAARRSAATCSGCSAPRPTSLDALVVGGASTSPWCCELLDCVLRALDVVLDFLRRRFDELARASDSVRRAYYVVDLLRRDRPRRRSRTACSSATASTSSTTSTCASGCSRTAPSRESVDCALIRAIVYDLGFAYEDGDPRRPSCAAGTALRGLLRAFFTYRGSLMWRMNAGMGDVVFLPFYELLVKRGVEVRFFHRVEDAHVAATAWSRRSRSTSRPHVPAATPPKTLRDARQPAVAGAAAGAAPTTSGLAPPIRRRIARRGQAASRRRTISESLVRVLVRRLATTRRSRRRPPDGEDFDLVVFGLPISCVPNVAPRPDRRSRRDGSEAVDRI